MVHLRESTGRNVEGVLGLPLFQRCVVQMDFEQGVVKILPGNTRPTGDWGTAIRSHYSDDGLVAVAAEVGDSVVEDFVLDTGFTGYVSLSATDFSRLTCKKMIIPGDEHSVTMAGGTKRVQEGRLSTFKIGTFESENIEVGNGSKSCLLGLNYLRGFRVTFDVARDRIYLAKRSGGGPPGELETIGMDFRRRFPSLIRGVPETIVIFVDADSPAAKAGIQIDDQLVSVNDESIEDMPIAEIRELLRKRIRDKSGLKLVMRQNGKVRIVSLK